MDRVLIEKSLNITGAIFAILGFLYTGYAFLDRRGLFLRKLSRGFSFGIVGMGIGAVGGALLILAFVPIVHPTASVFSVILAASALCGVLGFLFGFPYGIFSQLESPFSRRVPKRIKRTKQKGRIARSLEKSYLSSFWQQHQRLALLVGIGWSIIFLSIKPLGAGVQDLSILVLVLILAIFPLFHKKQPAIAGNIVLPSLPDATADVPHEADQQKFSWKWATFILSIGFILGTTLELLLFFFFRDPVSDAGAVFLVIFLICAIIARLDLFVKHIKLKLRAIRDENGTHTLQPLTNWPRFRRGFITGFVYIASFGYAVEIIKSLIGAITYGLTLGIIGGLIFGFSYGLAPAIAFSVEHLPERRLGQIGIGLGILGILISLLPTFIS